MIGKVDINGSKIILEDNGTIRCSNPKIQRLIQEMLEDYNYLAYSPSRGAFGHEFLSLVAQKFGGSVELSKVPDEGDDFVS